MGSKKRLLSIILSVLMAISIALTPSIQVKAERAVQGPDIKSIVKEHMKTIKDVDYKRVLVQKYGKAASDNKGSAQKQEQKINPDDNVRIIVEVQGQSVSQMLKGKTLSLSQRAGLEAQVENVQKPVRDKVRQFGTIRHTYKTLANGFSAVVKYKDIDSIRELPGVKEVRVAAKYYLDINSAKDLTNASTVLKDLGYDGTGTVVAVIDTGIDVNHKDMKLTEASNAKLNQSNIAAMGGPGHFYTDKVPYGYNFADMNDIIVDTTSSMHGMHVAGIIAANGNDEEVANNQAVKGVAPEAQLLAMKVFSNDPNNPSAFNDDIAAAIEDSFKHGADVINMSLGSTASFVDENDIDQKMIKAAVENNGVVVVTSAGNSAYSTSEYYYPYSEDPDMGVVGAPGLAPGAIQVASFENKEVLVSVANVNVGDEVKPIPYQKQESPDPVKVFGDKQLDVVYVGTGEPQYYEGKDVKDKIVFAVRTGDYFYRNIQKTAEDKGAAGVIIRGKESHGDFVNMALDNPFIPVVSLRIDDGNMLEKAAKDGKTLKVVFTDNKTRVANNNKDRMSDFTSWGSTPDLEFKPEVTAPGGEIYSTVNNDQYQTMSGTSMASPHTAGAAALIVQSLKQKGIDTSNYPEEVKTRLVNSAEPQIDPDVQVPYLTRVQGAGLIQIDKAIKSDVKATDENGNATAALKEIGKQTAFKIKLTNTSDNALKFKAVDNYGVLTNETSGGFIYPNAKVISGARLILPDEEITVPAKGSTLIDVILSLPDNTPSNIFAEGFIKFQPVDNQCPDIGIPYMGFYGNWSGQNGPRVFDAPVWDNSSYYGTTCLLDGEYYYLGQKGWNDDWGIPIIDPNCIAFSPNNDGWTDKVLPITSFMRNAKEFKVQIIDKDGNIVKEVSLDKNIRKNVPALGDYGYEDIYKLYDDWAWDGRIFNTKTSAYETAPEGQYTVRLLGLPDTGRPSVDNDWYRLDMPVKLDTTPPEFEVSGERLEGNKYRIKISNAHDYSDIQGFYVAYENNRTWEGLDYISDLNDIEKAETGCLEKEYVIPDQKGIIEVYAVDFAGNAQIEKVGKTTNGIKFEQLDNYYINSRNLTVHYSLNDIANVVFDHVGIIVDDGQEVNNGKNTGYELRDLPDGKHIVKAVVYSADGKDISEDTMEFFVDTQAPVLTITDPSTSPFALTNGENYYRVKMILSDNSGGYKLFLNDDGIYSTGPTGQDGLEEFEKEINLQGGQNKFTFKLVDPAGNETTKEIEIDCSLGQPIILLNNIKDGDIVEGKSNCNISGQIVYSTTMSAITVNNQTVDTTNYYENNGSVYTYFNSSVNFERYGEQTVIVRAEASDGKINILPVNIKVSPIVFDERHYFTNTTGQAIHYRITEPADEELSGASVNITVNEGSDAAFKIPVEQDKTDYEVLLDNLRDGDNTVRFDVVNTTGSAIVYDAVNVTVDKGLPAIENISCLGFMSDGPREAGPFSTLSDVRLNFIPYLISFESNEEFKNCEISVNDNLSRPLSAGEQNNTVAQMAANAQSNGNNFYGWWIDSNAIVQGPNRIRFKMTDMAGNTNEYEMKFYVDTEAPIVNIDKAGIEDYGYEGYIENYPVGKYTLHLKISDNTFGYKLYVNDNQIAVDENVDGLGTEEKEITYDLNITDGQLQDGKWDEFRIKAVDMLGNTYYYTLNISSDKAFINAEMLSESAVFDKNSPSDILAGIKFNSDSITKISSKLYDYWGKETSGDLISGQDYEIAATGESTGVIFKTNYLQTLAEGQHTLYFIFKSGDVKLFMINVVNTSNISKDAVLASIKIDGKPMPGFNMNIYDYIYEVDPFAAMVPTVTAEAYESNATVDITPATKIGETTVIKVTAQDGTTVKVYTIKFIRPLTIQTISQETSYTKGSNARLIFRAANEGDHDKYATLVVGLFDSQNKLVNYISGGYNIKANDYVDMSAVVSTEGVAKIKCFIWDNIENMRPLSEIKEFEVK